MSTIVKSVHENKVKNRAEGLISMHRRHNEPYTISFFGLELVIFPEVFSPELGEGSQLLAECMNIRYGEHVLDMGTGSGALAILAAKNAEKVIAVDISPVAVECAKKNVERLELENKVDVRQGDLFDSIDTSEKFSTIIFNPPFMEGKPTTQLDAAIYDEKYQTLRCFFEESDKYLTDDGRILIAFSTVGDIEYFNQLIEKSCFKATLVNKKVEEDMEFFVYELTIKKGIVKSFMKKSGCYISTTFLVFTANSVK